MEFTRIMYKFKYESIYSVLVPMYTNLCISTLQSRWNEHCLINNELHVCNLELIVYSYYCTVYSLN